MRKHSLLQPWKSFETSRLAVLLAFATVIYVPAQSTDVLTYHNDNAKTGQQLHEEILTPPNVRAAHFGKLWMLNVDGKVDALPRYAGTMLGASITFTATYAGTGDGSRGCRVIVDHAQYKECTGRLLLNGVLYTSCAGHCYSRPDTGWIIGYDAQTLADTRVI